MIWNKLVDRCLLFTDAPGGLLKELLKEAEVELATKLMIYESIYKLTVPATDYGFGQSSHVAGREHNYHKLPSDYLQDVGVTHKGTALRKMSDDEVRRKTDGQSYTGTPTAYSISGDYIVFNSAPRDGDVFMIHYKARMTERTSLKVMTLQYYRHDGPHIWLDTDLGTELIGLKINFEAQSRTLAAGPIADLQNAPGLPDIVNTNLSDNPNVNPGAPILWGSSYTIVALDNDDSLVDDAWGNANGALISVLNYRTIAPLIPEQFHTDLCSYAIAIANAKSSPETYNQYWTQWMMNMDNLVNEAADRDLIFSVREEI